MNEAPLGKAGRDVGTNHLRECGSTAPPGVEDPRQVPHQNGTSLADSGTLIHPESRRGVYRSKTGIIVPSEAVSLWRLLHLDRAKSVPQVDGTYGGRRVALTRQAFDRHLAGEVTLAFTVLCYQSALFAALDVDALFRELLSVIREAALAIGGEDLLAAIFCTSGSDDERGKIIVTFTEPVAARDARKLIRHLARRVRASEPAQFLRRNDIAAYPQEKTGGIVRVLGRNASRNGAIEAAFSLEGEPGLSHLCPLTPYKITQIVGRLSEPIAPWAKRRLELPWLRSEGGDKHFGRMVALAREATRIYGRAPGFTVYNRWLEKIRANSSELSLPSLKTKDSRNVLDHARKRAWDFANARPTSWEPRQLSIRKGMPRGVVRLYNALGSFVQRQGLRPSCFGIDYERIALLVDSSKSTAYRWLRRAEECGVAIIHDPGFRHTKFMRGKCTLIGLVGDGETEEQVRAAGASDERCHARTLERQRHATFAFSHRRAISRRTT